MKGHLQMEESKVYCFAISAINCVSHERFIVQMQTISVS